MKAINETLKKYSAIFSLLAVMIISFKIGVYLDMMLIANFTAIAVNIAIAVLIYFAISSSKDSRFYWLLTFGLMVAWVVCDGLWLIFDYATSEQEFGQRTFYAAPYTLCLVIISLIYKRCIDETRSKQLFIDICSIAILWVVLGIFTFYDIDVAILELLSSHKLTLYFIIIDILIICMAFTMLFDIVNLYKERSSLFLVLGIGFYAICDIVYVFYDFEDEVISSFIFEFMFDVAFVIVAFGVMFLKNEDKTSFKIRADKNLFIIFGKILVLASIPLIIIAYMGVVTLSHVTFSLMFVLLYGAVNYHIASVAHNEKMRKNDAMLSQKLNQIKQQRIYELKQTQAQLQERSKYDFLSSAYNKQYFETALFEMITLKTQTQSVSLYNIDIKRFKLINNIYGHYIGDEVLAKVVGSLKKAMPLGSIIGRYGGDDIMIATRESTSSVDHKKLVNIITQILANPITIEGNQISLKAKIGIASTQTSQIKVPDMLANVATALYVAKRQSDKNFAIYEELKINWQEYYTKSLLDSANFDKEFHLVYQPQFDINTKEIIGMEALLRWKSPLKGNISPAIFIPLAEQSPLIIHIERWVFANALKYIKEINEKYNLNLTISINVSSRQMDGVNYANEVIKTIKEHDIKPEWIALEITEMSWMNTTQTIQEILQIFKDNGIKVSIDDFGTGFSSVSYLNKFSINKLKIAKELVDNIHDDMAEKNIITAIISMAKTMNIQTIAEGVESDEQVGILRELGCDELQGYIWGKPMQAEVFELLLKG